MRTRYVIITALRAAALGSILPIFAVYYRHFDITLFQIAILAAIFEATILIMELPSGIWADQVSRRSAMIISECLLVTAGVLFVGWPGIWVFVIAEMFQGCGEAFGSGALEAWVIDEENIGHKSDEMEAVFTTAVRWKMISLVCGSLGAGILAAPNLRWAWAPFATLHLITLMVVLNSPERDHERPDPNESALSFRQRLQAGLALFGDNAILRLLIIFGFLAAFAEEGIDQFWQVHLHEIVAVPIGWFGVLVAVPAIIVFIFASRVIVGVRRRLAPGRAIAVLQLFYSIGVVGFALLAGLWSPVMLIGIFVLAELKRPILAAWTNEQIESTNRAGMLSVMNLVSSSGEVCAGLVFGYTTGLISLPVLFVAAAVFSVVAAGVIGRHRTATTGDS